MKYTIQSFFQVNNALSLPPSLSLSPFPSPPPSLGESVFARCLSSLKDERVEASKYLTGPSVTKYSGDKKEFIEHIRKALYASKIVSYAQGFMLMREAAKVYNWKLNYGGIALMWRGGCIIRRCVGLSVEYEYYMHLILFHTLYRILNCGKFSAKVHHTYMYYAISGNRMHSAGLLNICL
jgi:hypothetical protein